MIKIYLGIHVDIVNGESNRIGRKYVDGIISKFSETNGFNVLVLSPLAAGAGLNIQSANNVIHYGRWWNPAKEDQATARAHRIGQKRVVKAYFPILHHPDSIRKGFDVGLESLVSKKRKLAKDFLSPQESDISAADFNSILKGNKHD